MIISYSTRYNIAGGEGIQRTFVNDGMMITIIDVSHDIKRVVLFTILLTY